MAKRKAKKQRRLKLWVSLGMTEETEIIDLPDDWDCMSVRDRELHITAEAETLRNNRVEYGGEVLEDDE